MNNHHWYKDELLVFPLTLDTYTREEVLQRLGQLLYEHGYVKESYINAIIEREKKYPTGLPTQPGVAIPHTDTIHTNELALAVAILDKPVKFYEMGNVDCRAIDVQIVFALSVPEPKEVIKRLQLLFSVIQDPSFLTNLIGYQDRRDISAYLDNRLNIRLSSQDAVVIGDDDGATKNKDLVEKTILIQHPVGLHARPASLFVQIAKRYQSDVNVTCNGRKANAKSILSVLQLGAKQGSLIQIQARGEDREQAVNALYELVESNFGESV